MINPFGSAIGSMIASSVDPSSAVSAASVSNESGGDFGNMFSSMLQDAVGAVKSGEAAAIAGMQNKMPLQQVVEAVMQAEQSLHTAVAVRDKVVGAYLEISRMQM